VYGAGVEDVNSWLEGRPERIARDRECGCSFLYTDETDGPPIFALCDTHQARWNTAMAMADPVAAYRYYESGLLGQ
jgi:hypothetical protein